MNAGSTDQKVKKKEFPKDEENFPHFDLKGHTGIPYANAPSYTSNTYFCR